jgi:AcrR family transcriptional regulator
MVQIAATAPRALERKRAIVAAASRVFRERGLPATGMREIAAELDMAVGNLYYYFRDKGELVAFVQDEALAALLALADRVLRLPLPVEERLYLLVVGHVVLINESTPGALAHLDLEALADDARSTLQDRRDDYERRLRQLLDEGVETGRLRPTDARLSARFVLGALNWTAKWFRPAGGKSAEEIGRAAAELLVNGLLAPGIAPPRIAAPLMVAGLLAAGEGPER